MNRRTSYVIRTVLLICLAIAGVLTPGEAHAASCANGGNPVTSDFTLPGGITDCTEHGIEVGAAGITINLGGHTLDGDNDAEDFGIYNPGFNNVTIVGPGTIQQFGGGIRIEDANNNKVQDEVNVTDNRGHGIAYTQVDDLNGVTKGASVTDSLATANDLTGIILYRGSSKAIIDGNTVHENGGDGIFLGGAGENTDLDGDAISGDIDDLATKVSNAKVTNNGANDNEGTGIAIVATGKRSVEADNDTDEDDASGGSENTISGNSASNNGQNIEVENSNFRQGVGHEVRSCCADRGGHGIKVAGTLDATKIKDNTANGNGTPNTADDCFERNGAGIFVAGRQKGITISGNTTDDNAMAGIFAGGTLKKLGVKLNPAVTANNVNCEDDEAGIVVTGRNKGVSISQNGDVSGNNGSGVMVEGHTSTLKIAENVITNNIAAGGGGTEDTAGILVHGRTLNLSIVNNTSSSNSNTSGVLGHGIDVRGSVRKVGKARQAVSIKNNTTSDNEGHGIGVFVEQSKPINNTDPQDDDLNQNDSTQNKTGLIKVTGNDANNNGTDGIFAIADLTLANNTANDNTDFGIEHNSNPTVAPRFADAADGPHKLKDGGGNSAAGNGTDCSPGLNC